MTAHPIQSTLPVLPARCGPDEATLDAHETATVTVRDLAPGKHTLTATYPGTTTTAPSTGTVTVTVRR